MVSHCRGFAGLLAAALLFQAHARAADLYFGADGTGGNGAWDTTTVDWWNGSAAVPWAAGGSARFAGAAGTVVTGFPGPSVSAITFDTPGYVLAGSTSLSASLNLTITTNANATVNAPLSSGFNNATLFKEGSAALTIGGVNFSSNVQIDAGELRIPSGEDLFFSKTTLANAPGVTLTMSTGATNSKTFNVASLAGGGTSGGVVQPDNVAATVTLYISGGTATFGGVLRDNGAGQLALRDASSGTETLTNVNTYTGATEVDFGTLVLSGQGTIAPSPTLTAAYGTLRLDNTVTPISNRLYTGAPVTLALSALELLGNVNSPVSETLGQLTFSGDSSVNVVQPSTSPTQLTFTGLTRQSSGVLNFPGTASTVKIAGLSTTNGILPVYLTSGSEWASLDGQGFIQPFATYATLSSGLVSDNVKISGAGTVTLSASGSRYSLNLQNASSTHAVLDLGGNALSLGSGGLLTSGTGVTEINNGTLSSGTSTLLLQNRADLQIGATIADGGSPTSLIKFGTGKLTLSGLNSYSGGTSIEEGILAAGFDQNFGVGSIAFLGGTLQATASFTLGRTFTGSPVIDTNGFNLTLANPFSGSLYKSGAGTLSLLGNYSNSATLSAGKLILTKATSGSLTLANGTTLQVAGRLTGLTLNTTARLDVGGSGPATLLLDNLSNTAGSKPKLTIDFDLGSSAGDFLYFSSTSSSTSASSGFGGTSYLFSFHDLGGTQTGIDYPLISLPSSGSFSSANLTLSQFSFAPEALAAGYQGTFKVTSDQVLVDFSAVPEPGPAALLLSGAALLAFRRRSRFSPPQSTARAPRICD